jgi:non-specific serine/threonine protein kinase
VAGVVADSEPRRAARLLGAAEALRERAGALVAAVEQRRYAELVARVQRRLRPETFSSAWREGRSLTRDQAVELALREAQSQVAQAVEGVTAEAEVLSKREREIAQLIARGQSNLEIGEALVISIKTVETHVQHMFRKLQVQSRAEIAVFATRHGLA